ncbi:MAG: cytochrome c nitrite reductase small subunit [Gemmatimonadota bacterium]
MTPLKLTVAAALIAGAALGIGGYTFIYAEGASYFGHDASACANCHVMNDHYAAWMKGSHSDVATCNDCHTPPGTVSKYLTKASSGWRHASAFTTGGFPERLQITESGARVTEQACRSCHEEMTAVMTAGHDGAENGDGVSCVRCHADVGHWVR